MDHTTSQLRAQLSELRFERSRAFTRGRDVTRMDRELARLEAALKAVTVPA